MRRSADLVGQGEPTVAQRREMLEAHRSDLARRLREIGELMPMLDAKISSYGRPEADAVNDTEEE